MLETDIFTQCDGVREFGGLEEGGGLIFGRRGVGTVYNVLKGGGMGIKDRETNILEMGGGHFGTMNYALTNYDTRLIL